MNVGKKLQKIDKGRQKWGPGRTGHYGPYKASRSNFQKQKAENEEIEGAATKSLTTARSDHYGP